MPRNKDFKRLVRARMQKTGEAYTAARANVLRKSKPLAPRSRADEPSKSVAGKPVDRPDQYATLAGMSDAAIKAKTGCTWDRWVRALDHYGAAGMSHREIAELVATKYKVGPWWTQTVAVGYERIKGLRARGQKRNGTFEASKSRTFSVPIDALYDAWADASVRRRWLRDLDVSVRTATPRKYMRLGLDDGGIVAVGFTAKGTGKSAVAVSQTKLADSEAVRRVKESWSERFEALGALLDAR